MEVRPAAGGHQLHPASERCAGRLPANCPPPMLRQCIRRLSDEGAVRKLPDRRLARSRGLSAVPLGLASIRSTSP